MSQSKSKKSKSKPNATAAGGARVPQNARLNFYVLLRAPLQCVKIKEIKFKNQMQVGQREPPISVHSIPGCTMCPGSPDTFRTMRSCPLPTGRGVLYVDTEQDGFLRLRSLPPPVKIQYKLKTTTMQYKLKIQKNSYNPAAPAIDRGERAAPAVRQVLCLRHGLLRGRGDNRISSSSLLLSTHTQQQPRRTRLVTLVIDRSPYSFVTYLSSIVSEHSFTLE